MTLKKNIGLTILMVLTIASVLIPFRLKGPIMDACCDIGAGTSCQSQGGCTDAALERYAKRSGAEYCENSYPDLGWAWCTYPKTFLLREITFSVVRSLAEKNLKWITLEEYRSILDWTS